ncbi:MAG: hypothetical protein IT350_04475 [Deltaproteobacteria bacterium]|nr:hypothetical protein [Deltaproteobacteria bacterium]
MEDDRRKDVLAEAKRLMNAGDSRKAAEFIINAASPIDAAGLFLDLVKDWYWKEKDLPMVILASQAGIHFCLQKAMDESDAETARALRQKAMSLSYNLASFAWPAWDDALIVTTDTTNHIALDAAYLHVRLAMELGVDAEKMSAAQWVVGAAYLAMEEYEPAGKAFELARNAAFEAGSAAFEDMNAGYMAIAAILSGDERARGRFDEACARLRERGDEDSTFFADQLTGVLTFFERSPA